MHAWMHDVSSSILSFRCGSSAHTVVLFDEMETCLNLHIEYDAVVGYNMGLAHIIFNKSNKALWFIILSAVWFNTV